MRQTLPAFRLALLLLGSLLLPSWAGAQTCGGLGQRACCVGESNFGACRSGLTEMPKPLAGRCGGINPFGVQSSGECVAVTPCGGVGQRACCSGESAFGACDRGLAEVERPNSGQCAGALPGVQSSGVCVAVSACGGDGQRACCSGESSFGACSAGLVEIPRPASGLCAGALPGIQSSSVCAAPAPCGGDGQRACCINESNFGACRAGLEEVVRPNNGQCAGALPGIQSNGVCQRPATYPSGPPPCPDGQVLYRNQCWRQGLCGRDGLRPCVMPEPAPACKEGLVEIDGVCQAPFDQPLTLRQYDGAGATAARPVVQAAAAQGLVGFSALDATTDEDATDAGFIKRRGLADARCASYESMRFPGRFLRVPGQLLRLGVPVGRDLALELRLATFCRKGVAGNGEPFGLESVGRPGEFIASFDGEASLLRVGELRGFDELRPAYVRELTGLPVLPLIYEGFLTPSVRAGDHLNLWFRGECSPLVTRQDVLDRLRGRPARTSSVAVRLRYAPGEAPAPTTTHRWVSQTASTEPFARFAPMIQLQVADPRPRPAGTPPIGSVAKIVRSRAPCPGEWADAQAKALMRQLGALP